MSTKTRMLPSTSVLYYHSLVAWLYKFWESRVNSRMQNTHARTKITNAIHEKPRHAERHTITSPLQRMNSPFQKQLSPRRNYQGTWNYSKTSKLTNETTMVRRWVQLVRSDHPPPYSWSLLRLRSYAKYEKRINRREVFYCFGESEKNRPRSIPRHYGSYPPHARTSKHLK